MKEGKTFSFSSKTPGPKGRREVMAKFDQWYYSEGTGEKTVNNRLYIAPRCGSRKICKMTLRDWQRIINEAQGAKKPLSEKTLKSLRGIIMGIIKFGYQDYQCELLRGDLYIPRGRYKGEKEILQNYDIKKLLEPSDLWYHPLFCFLLLTGMRPGEALGLQVSDFSYNRVTIRRAINAKKQITEGKNENARRVIPIGELADGILRQTIRRNEEMNLDTEWIFCSPDGSQGNQSTMRNHWNQLKKERGLPGSVYSLRHTFISMMKSVLPEQSIKDVVGHSVSMDTFGTYGHIIEGEDKKIAQVIDLTFTNIEKELPNR